MGGERLVTTSVGRRLPDGLVAFAIFAFALLSYRSILDLPFTAIDTIPTVVAARADSWADALGVPLRELRGGAAAGQYYYRPLTLSTYTLDYALWGWSPRGYHWTDLLLHGIAGVAVFAMARRALDRGLLAAAAVALLFLLHPAANEVVPAISRRQEPLLVVGFCLAVIGARRAPSRWDLMLVGSAVAVASVERGLAVPSLVFGYLLFYRLDGQAFLSRLQRAVLWTLPSAAVAVGFFTLRWALYGTGGVAFDLANLWKFPPRFGLMLLYPQQIIDLVAPTGPAGVLAYAAVVALGAAAVSVPALRSPDRPAMLFALSWIGFYLLLIMIAGQLNPWYVYSAVPALALTTVFLFGEGLRWLRTARSGRLLGVPPLAVAVGLATVLVIPSPVLRDYPAWRMAGELGERLLADLETTARALPPGESLLLVNLPGHIVESDTDYLITRSAAILWPRSIEAWRLELGIENEILVLGAADHVGTARVPEIEFLDDHVRVYFRPGAPRYTNGDRDWPGARPLPGELGNGFDFPLSSEQRRAPVYVFDGERLRLHAVDAAHDPQVAMPVTISATEMAWSGEGEEKSELRGAEEIERKNREAKRLCAVRS